VASYPDYQDYNQSHSGPSNTYERSYYAARTYIKLSRQSFELLISFSAAQAAQRRDQYNNGAYSHPPANQTQVTRGSNPRNAAGVRLRPVSDLRQLTNPLAFASNHNLISSCSADVYRPMFKFGVFNAVQSTCFDTVFLLKLPFYPSHTDFLLKGDAFERKYGTFASRRCHPPLMRILL
jgi:hypothetical protein